MKLKILWIMCLLFFGIPSLADIVSTGNFQDDRGSSGVSNNNPQFEACSQSSAFAASIKSKEPSEISAQKAQIKADAKLCGKSTSVACENAAHTWLKNSPNAVPTELEKCLGRDEQQKLALVTIIPGHGATCGGIFCAYPSQCWNTALGPKCQ